MRDAMFHRGLLLKMDWSKLRSWNNSQNNAFEELICQLAQRDSEISGIQIPQGSEFKRLAPPDGGVEGYWVFPDGQEHGWQAKYIIPPLTNKWAQVDKSVKRAIETHPKLVSYTICFPFDRTDPRKKGQLALMDHWNNAVKRWEKYAKGRRRKVRFYFWGSFEINERLSLDENLGRRYFWFNEVDCNQKWFENHIKRIKISAGERYTPKLHVEIPIKRAFEGLGRTEEYWKEYRAKYLQIKKEYGNMVRSGSSDIQEGVKKVFVEFEAKHVELAKSIFHKRDKGYFFLEKYTSENQLDEFKSKLDEEEFRTLQRLGSVAKWPIRVEELLSEIKQSLDAGFFDFDNQKLDNLGNSALNTLLDLRNVIEKIKAVSTKEKTENKQTNGLAHEKGREFDYVLHYIHQLLWAIKNYLEFLSDHSHIASNRRALLLIGDALIGKTHLLCDVAEKRISNNQATILILGQTLTGINDPWRQILQDLDLRCSKDEFLGALDAYAQAKSCRALIMVDALNEGAGEQLWFPNLAGFIYDIQHYQSIGVALSVRTSEFKPVISPEAQKCLHTVSHSGFLGVENLAISTYCKHFKLKPPLTPIINRELLNPGFFKLLCETLKGQGRTQIPSGSVSVQDLFDSYLKTINEKISHSTQLNYSQETNKVEKAVKLLAKKMAEKGEGFIEYETAQKLIDKVLPGREYNKSLFSKLISEGVIARDWDYGGNKIIRFSYQRFENIYVARFLLEKNISKKNIRSSFNARQPLGKIIANEWRNRSLLDAFSVILPELYGAELIENINKPTYALVESLLQSLVWRDPKSISKNTLSCIRKYAFGREELFRKYLETLLNVSADPNHPLNADYLHDRLIKMTMPHRDAGWTIYLNETYPDEGCIIGRLVDWAWSDQDRSNIDDKSIRLYASILIWFFTSSNRHLRDTSAKALVSLLKDRTSVIVPLLEQFKAVDDPYVHERLLAAVHGVCLIKKEFKELKEIAQYVYGWIFANCKPPVHILIRDHARGIIMRAIHLGMIKDEWEIGKITPPYSSEPVTRYPTKEEVEELGKWEQSMPEEEFGRTAISRSLLGFVNDFGRYVVEGKVEHWSSHFLKDTWKPTKKELYREFIDSLNQRQKAEWKLFEDARSSYFVLMIGQKKKILKKEINKKISVLKIAEKKFVSSLTAVQKNKYKNHVIPYLEDSREDRPVQNAKKALEWMLKRVFELGWDVKRFGKHDRYIDRYSNRGREPNKPERIGKKYQWIALHEYLARLADNYVFWGESHGGKPSKYDGPWQIGARQIDPSAICKPISETVNEGLFVGHHQNWWFTEKYSSWDIPHDDERWIKGQKDLPKVESIMQVVNVQDKAEWLTLEGTYMWKEPLDPEADKYSTPRKEIYYMVKSYIVRKKDAHTFYSWAKKQDFFGRWMPELRVWQGDTYMGEYYWGNAYEDYYEWTKGGSNKLPAEVMVSADYYMHSAPGFDCSFQASHSFHLPAKWLHDKMELSWSGRGGDFLDKRGQLVCTDPSFFAEGPGALLIRKNALRETLENNDCELIWTILGEKNTYPVNPQERVGVLKISGAFILCDKGLKGKMNNNYEKWR